MWLLHSNLVGVVIFRGSLRTFEHTLKINYGETCMIFISRLVLKKNCTVSYVIDTWKAGLKMCMKKERLKGLRQGLTRNAEKKSILSENRQTFGCGCNWVYLSSPTISPHDEQTYGDAPAWGLQTLYLRILSSETIPAILPLPTFLEHHQPRRWPTFYGSNQTPCINGLSIPKIQLQCQRLGVKPNSRYARRLLSGLLSYCRTTTTSSSYLRNQTQHAHYPHKT